MIDAIDPNAEHWPVGTIASQLGVHRDVVRRVLGVGIARPGAGTPRPTPLDPESAKKTP